MAAIQTLKLAVACTPLRTHVRGFMMEIWAYVAAQGEVIGKPSTLMKKMVALEGICASEEAVCVICKGADKVGCECSKNRSAPRLGQ